MREPEFAILAFLGLGWKDWLVTEGQGQGNGRQQCGEGQYGEGQ